MQRVRAGVLHQNPVEPVLWPIRWKPIVNVSTASGRFGVHQNQPQCTSTPDAAAAQCLGVLELAAGVPQRHVARMHDGCSQHPLDVKDGIERPHVIQAHTLVGRLDDYRHDARRGCWCFCCWCGCQLILLPRMPAGAAVRAANCSMRHREHR